MFRLLLHPFELYQNVIRNFLYILLLSCSFSVLITERAQASHAMGADLTYTCLGGDQYAITLAFYRDCSGINAPSSMPIVITSSCGNMNISLQNVSMVEVSLLCPTAVSTCQGGSQPGVEQWIYTDTVTLVPCSDWTLSWTHCCRNPLIDNLVNPAGEEMYIQATLNNSNGCNSSPIFTNLPVPYTCNQQMYNYNHGAVDADGDSIVYTLVNPLSAGGTPIGYTAGYTPTYPIFTTSGSVLFNTQTGQMDFEPTGNQVCVVTILVEEYRNGVLIGTTMRDIQVIDVLNCSNFQPALQAPGIFNLQNSTWVDSLTVEACVGASLSYNYIVADPDIPDSIFFNSNIAIAIPGATLTQTGVNPIVVSLNWTPQIDDIGLNFYTVTFQDNGCPVIGTSTIAFSINVISGTYAGGDFFLCDGDTAQLTVGGGTIFQWSPPLFLNNDTIYNPLAYPPTTQTYVVTSDLSGSCSNVDTITVNVVTDFTLTTSGDQILCNGGSAQLNAFASPAGSYVYSWTPSTSLSSDSVPDPIASPSSTTAYQVSVSAPNGCTKQLYQLVTVSPTPLSSVPTVDDAILCFGSQTQVHANIDPGNCNVYNVSTVPFSPLSGTGTNVILGDDFVSGGLNIGFDFVFICNYYDQFHISSNGFITFDAASSNGCCSGQVIPNGTAPNNLIAWAWEDLNPTAGGTVDYLTVGAAPNRVCIININSIQHYGGGNAITTQILLYEGSNFIEIHTTSMPSDGGNHTMGIENAGGTLGFPAPGRNSTSWNATNDAFRWTPLTPPPYTITWLDMDSNVVGITDNVTISPDSNMTYTIIVTDGVCLDTKTIDVGVSKVTVNPDTAMCLGDSVPLLAVYQGPTGAQAPAICGLTAGCGGSGGNNPYTVGTGTLTNSSTVYPAPYGNWYRNAKHQFLYTATDLTAAGVTAGTFTEIGFYVTTIFGTTQYNSYQIKIGCTSISSITSWQAGLTTVFTPKNIAISTGLNNHILDSPYDWDGTSNIIVEICYNNLSTAYTNNSASPYTTTGYTSAIYYRSDGTAACPYTASQTTSNNRPNTKFSVCTDLIIPQFSWTPNTNISNDTIPNPFVSPQVPTTYVVTVDNGSCILTDTVNVAPGGFDINLATVDVSCAGWCDGASTATPLGVAPYTYIWDDLDTQLTAAATGLCAGIYTVTITDATGCISLKTDTLSDGGLVNAAMLDSTDVSCYNDCNGIATVNPTGGLAPYVYLWDNGEINAQAITLCADTHMVVVADIKGCTDTSYVIILEPAPLLSQATAACAGLCDGTATVAITGGTGPYTYLWDDSGSQTSSTATGLCGGVYTAIVTDANNCTLSDSASLPSPTIQTVVTDATCIGICDGEATATLSGGTAPYAYLWDDTGTQTTGTATSLCVGAYTVQVTDSEGCMMIDNIDILELSSVTPIEVSTTGVSCYGYCDGEGEIEVTEQSPPYSFIWDDGQTTATPTNLCAGVYNVTVSNSVGCLGTLSITITEPPVFVATTVPAADILCDGQCDGVATVSAIGGTAPYIYSWDDGANQSTATAINLCSGNYTATITDDQGCSVNASLTIIAPPKLTATAANIGVNCTYDCDGLITITTGGGVTPYNYLWNDPQNQTTAMAINLCVGLYVVEVTDANGCPVFLIDSITSAPALPNIPAFGADMYVTTIFNTDIIFYDMSLGATTYSWDFGDGSGATVASPTHTFPQNAPGVYTVVLTTTNSLGCSETASRDIVIKGDFSLFAPNSFTPNGDGMNETFFPKGTGIDLDNFNMYIFNRWGDKIFETDNIRNQWDGTVNKGKKKAQMDTYIWLIVTYDQEGVEHKLVGKVTMIY